MAGSVRHMTVVRAERAKALRMRGGLGPLQEPLARPVDAVLMHQIQRLKRFVESGRPE